MTQAICGYLSKELFELLKVSLFNFHLREVRFFLFNH